MPSSVCGKYQGRNFRPGSVVPWSGDLFDTFHVIFHGDMTWWYLAFAGKSSTRKQGEPDPAE